MSSTATSAIGTASVTAQTTQNIAAMNALASAGNASTLASAQIAVQQAQTSALATVANNAGKNMSDAAKGQ